MLWGGYLALESLEQGAITIPVAVALQADVLLLLKYRYLNKPTCRLHPRASYGKVREWSRAI